jgi:hypothetical protein
LKSHFWKLKEALRLKEWNQANEVEWEMAHKAGILSRDSYFILPGFFEFLI